jgi:hypothetical protein
MMHFTTTCDVYRPFGDATPLATGIACRLVPHLRTTGSPMWTHYVDLPDGTDVRDGCSRRTGSTDIDFADGDEVRVGATRYAVVWVERHNVGCPKPYLRAYLARHEASWPNP